MLCPNLTADCTDDPHFVALVARIIIGTIVTHRPPEVRVFKIDHWFDHKWLKFSGKVLGALGVWSKRLTIPPFVANRVIDQWQYIRSEASGTYQLIAPGPNIHHRGQSADNLFRSVKHIAPTSALFWYSGDTADTSRGSLMGYIPVEADYWPWFLAFARNVNWQVARRKDIHEYEVRLFRQTGERVEQGAAADRPRE